MRKRFSLGSKTVEVSFFPSASKEVQDGDEEIVCECDWSGGVEGLEQQVHGRRVNLKCPDCSSTLAEVVYTTLGKEGSDARLSSTIDNGKLDEEGQTHVSSNSSPQYLQ
jgi:hypothetical protein